jgi:cellulose synthase/poly-beta-1,6-N-acetylglucosamine synthase-like glycosyltransferase
VPGRGSIVQGVGTSLVALGSVAWLSAAAGWFRGVRRAPVLREVGKNLELIDHYPSVAVVVPARDEEAGVGEALRSLLDQDYPGSLEILAVDDRSTDRTGEIIAGLAARCPGRLPALRVDDLPEGWARTTHSSWGRGSQRRVATRYRRGR